MTLEEFRTYCLSLPSVTEEFPFDQETVVFKLHNKMFALANITSFEFFSVKCDPDDSLAIRNTYQEVFPGYHLNKRHWISVPAAANIPEELKRSWITDSYELIRSKLPRAIREQL